MENKISKRIGICYYNKSDNIISQFILINLDSIKLKINILKHSIFKLQVTPFHAIE